MGQRPRDDSEPGHGVREASDGAGAEPAPAAASQGAASQGAATPGADVTPRRQAPGPAGAEASPRLEAGHGQVDGSERDVSSPHDERQGRLAIEQAPSADALLKQWYQRYPRTFFKGHTRPLKVGIHHDLAAREPWPEKLVRRALAGYVNLPRYLKAVREEAERIDLDGEPAGSVDAQAAEHAKRKLERLQSERRERGRTEGGAPRRSGKGNRGRDAADHQPRKAGRGPTQRSAKPAPADSQAPGDAPAPPADPAARMEAKLSALLAKHNGQAKGH
ncbi:ProQ/FinO family protein [Halomonas sp. MCCC 1A17488]|nr:ProQ/FinO family protein [Halomonas sp. MCCC 1A17488]MCG3241510.1 ProQ/FinO family protein [Halomonas sp. MCCC 1A17488]QPP51660.1 ProQ/FinO family protein [Halomonas sp. SS10-MC5]